MSRGPLISRKALRQRVKKATGASRKLDRLIGQVLHTEIGLSEDEVGLVYPKYTASIDAALALVAAKLPQWRPIIYKAPPVEGDPANQDWLAELRWEARRERGRAATAPLALMVSLIAAVGSAAEPAHADYEVTPIEPGSGAQLEGACDHPAEGA